MHPSELKSRWIEDFTLSISFILKNNFTPLMSFTMQLWGFTKKKKVLPLTECDILLVSGLYLCTELFYQGHGFTIDFVLRKSDPEGDTLWTVNCDGSMLNVKGCRIM